MFDPDQIRRGFRMNRTTETLVKAEEALRYNPMGLPFKELKEVAAGSKGVPLYEVNPEKLRYDPLHTLLSFGRFGYNVMLRLNSGIRGQWDITQKERELYKHYERELQDRLAEHLGIYAKFGQIDGNKARTLLNPLNIDKLLLCLNENVMPDEKRAFKYIAEELGYIYSFIASSSPRDLFCFNEFNERTTDLMVYLTTEWSWFNLGTYLHISTAHSLEILEHTESIGRNSTEVKLILVYLAYFYFN